MNTNYNSMLLDVFRNVAYNDKYKIMQGSVGQLMMGINIAQERISYDRELDRYKKSLYPELRSLCYDILCKFKSILQAENEKEYFIIKYNIFGYDGCINREGVTGTPYVAGVNPKTQYGYANFGLLLKVIKQRLLYISTKDMPSRYLSDSESAQIYNKLRGQCSELLSYISDEIEEKWKKYVSIARKNGGDEVEYNLKKRTEKKELVKKHNMDERKKSIEFAMKKNIEDLNNKNLAYYKSKIAVR